MAKKLKEIRAKKLKEEAPVNSTGESVSTNVPIVRKKPLILRRKSINMKA